ncbi:hypothetical protein GCM10010357_64780 [Streptomyces luteireticuli]|uniref:DUF1929 domain-containing protein n=2 Tax=Streptomyces luteireticuli TaxID=173858 RepID=A0ABN0Z699_9ACTN
MAVGAAGVIALSTLTLLTAPPAATSAPMAQRPGLHITEVRVRAAVLPAEVAAFGRAGAEALAGRRLAAAALADDDYPQSTRTASYEALKNSQADENAQYQAAQSGKFTEYFPSPDFGDHVALLPTGEVLLFSFEMFESNPTKEPAPTQQIGAKNTGRAYVWNPALGYGADAFTAVPTPAVDMDDGTGIKRAAPIFCAGHAYLPNGMVAVFGGNLGRGVNGAGARFAFVFDPWKKEWHRQRDMTTGRWYPSVVTGADGRQLIMSGQDERGWNNPAKATSIERFPARDATVSYDKSQAPDQAALDKWKFVQAPYKRDYPHLFSMRDGKVYGLGRDAEQQWKFDPETESRTTLADRPDGGLRNYGSAVPLPNGANGPDTALILGGDPHSGKTYKFSSTTGQWTDGPARSRGRTQDDTVILPNGNLLTVNGAMDIRDYGGGDHNPNVPDEWLPLRHTETLDASGKWTVGPAQRLPRGYHSNAVLLPDGRIMVTGDELQQMANNPAIRSGMNGTIEIYEPPYLNQGARPSLSSAPNTPVAYGSSFKVTTDTPTQAKRAVLMAPISSTHSVDTTQRRLELPIVQNVAGQLTLRTPASANEAPPGYYMLFLLNDAGVPSIARWVQLRPNA